MPVETVFLIGSETRLIVTTTNLLAVLDVSQFLASLDKAYVCLRQFESFAHNAARYAQPPLVIEDLILRVLNIKVEGLMIGRIRVESPGIWEFIGKLFPFEVIRKGLNDRHERKKDESYRNSQEEKRLRLENMSRETGVVRERIDLLRSAGFPEDAIQELVKTFITEPLIELQDNSRISHEAFIEGE
ncbi:MAG TPA: hypothetical protein VGK24_11000 [Candidatus Angelobacter sp.]|jgi:hypothetical protein